MKYKDFFKEICNDLKSIPKLGNINSSELSDGISIETEHTNDAKLAKTIAMHHLSEDPYYYSKLKNAGLADELKKNVAIGYDHSMEQSDKMAMAAGLSHSNDKKSSIVEPDTTKIDKQTTQGTVYPPVENDIANGVNMSGGIEQTTNDVSSNSKTDVDTPAKDPTPTDHITGGIGLTPSNPNIISKQPTQSVVQSIIPQDISIDIAEGKKLLNKMKKELTKDPINAFCPQKEGFGGDPNKDKAYVKGKRWTVKWK